MKLKASPFEKIKKKNKLISFQPESSKKKKREKVQINKIVNQNG